ncbi:MAG: hypothetical protein F6K14_31240 [Symploca sp. SIO2C1]|nr:hypothetical protein [Symploca sp. SIO2C1]
MNLSSEKRQKAGGRRQKAQKEADLFLIFFFDVEIFPTPYSLLPAPCVVRRLLPIPNSRQQLYHILLN